MYLADACDEFMKVGYGVARPLLRFRYPWDSVEACVYVAKHSSQRQLLNQWCVFHLQHGEPCGT